MAGEGELESWQARAFRDWCASVKQWRHDLAVAIGALIAFLLYRYFTNAPLRVGSLVPLVGSVAGGLVVYGLVMAVFHCLAAPARVRDDEIQRLHEQQTPAEPQQPIQPLYVSAPDPAELVRLIAERGDEIAAHQAQNRRFKDPKRMADFRALLDNGQVAIAQAKELAESEPERPDRPTLDKQWLQPVTRWHGVVKGMALDLFPDKPAAATEIFTAGYVQAGRAAELNTPETVAAYRQRILAGYETFLGAWQAWMKEYDASMTPEAKQAEADFNAHRAARLAEREADRAAQRARQLQRRKAERPEHLATLIDLLQHREDHWGDQSALTPPGLERLSGWANKVKQAIQRVYWDDERLIVTLGWVTEGEGPANTASPGAPRTIQVNHSGTIEQMTGVYLAATKATLRYMRKRGDLR